MNVSKKHNLDDELSFLFTINFDEIKNKFKYKNIVYINYIKHHNSVFVGYDNNMYPDSDLYELYLIEKIDEKTFIYYHYHAEHWYDRNLINIKYNDDMKYFLNMKENIINLNKKLILFDKKLILFDKNLEFVLQILQEKVENLR